MSKFCGKCGAQQSGPTPFCASCGADLRPDASAVSVPAPAPTPVVNPNLPPPNYPAQNYPAQNYPAPNYPPAAGPAPAKSSPLIKILVAVFILIFIFGGLVVGGIFYAAHKVHQKTHELLGDFSNEPVRHDANPCRYLSTADVATAIGIPIIRAEAQGSGCAYIAHGDPADMTAKHTAAMLGNMGMDQKSQDMAQKFAGGIFQQQQSADKSLADQAAKQETTVFAVDISTGNAVAEMKLNKGTLGLFNAPSEGKGTAGSDYLAGVGDEAFQVAGGMMLVRKGNTLFRLNYESCPCSTPAIKPLAEKLASQF